MRHTNTLYLHTPTPKPSFSTGLLGLTAKLAIFVFVTTPLPLWLAIEQFLPRNLRPRFWRAVSWRTSKGIVWLAGVRVAIAGQIPRDETLLFVSNHPSELDGLILFSIIGPDLVSVTGPLGIFPAPFRFWFKKIGAIDVRRDAYDDLHYKTAHSKHHALECAKRTLEHGINLLIFPEGHVEREHFLHYIHTGASRIALASGCRIAPVSIVGLERIFFKKGHLNPGTCLVTFGRPITPENFRHYPNRHGVDLLTRRIEEALIELMPRRYLPPEYHIRAPKRVGVFLDIDRTLYEGFTIKDFAHYLFSHGLIAKHEAFHLASLMVLERLEPKRHEELVSEALGFLHHYDLHELYHLAHHYFHDEGRLKLYHNLLPTITDHIKAGHRLVLVTETIDPLAELFRDILPVSGVIDTKLECRHGHYTGHVKQLCWNEAKRQLVSCFATRHSLDLEKSYAYSDSHTDLPLLSLVGHPVAVNPDKKLARVASERKWTIME